MKLPVGWLSVYLSGYLHRDPSLGNFLFGRVENEGFKIPQDFLDGASLLRNGEEIKEKCERVQKLVVKLGISNECSAVITDGDLSVSWKNYWEAGHQVTKSVSDFLVSQMAGLDQVYRVHPCSCHGCSLRPVMDTCIHLWMTWNHFSGLRSGVCSSTRKVENKGRRKGS